MLPIEKLIAVPPATDPDVKPLVTLSTFPVKAQEIVVKNPLTLAQELAEVDVFGIVISEGKVTVKYPFWRTAF